MKDTDQLTNDILTAVSRCYPDSLCWRNNTGMGVGWSLVKRAVGLIKARQYSEAIRYLNVPVSWGLVGSSDIFVLIGGRFGGIEVKTGSDTQSVIQKSFEAQVIRAGGFYILARDREECLAELAQAVRSTEAE